MIITHDFNNNNNNYYFVLVIIFCLRGVIEQKVRLAHERQLEKLTRYHHQLFWQNFGIIISSFGNRSAISFSFRFFALCRAFAESLCLCPCFFFTPPPAVKLFLSVFNIFKSYVCLCRVFLPRLRVRNLHVFPV